MKRRTFLGSIAALFGASRVAAEPEPVVRRQPTEAECRELNRLISLQVLGRDPLGQAIVEARARRDVDEGELLTDDDVDYFEHISGVPREDKMPGMHGEIVFGERMLEGTQPPATGVVKLGDRFGSFGRVEKINDDGTNDVAIVAPMHPVGVRTGEIFDDIAQRARRNAKKL